VTTPYGPLPRLRQLVLASADLSVVARLQHLLRAPDPYLDEGIAHFGLVNAVLNVGSSFVEVIAPQQDGTAVGRFLERRGGPGGYMLMAEVADAAAARARIAEQGVRLVHEGLREDAVDLHLHPRDVGGTLLALDEMTPAGSWCWGGDAWTQRTPEATGGLREVVVAVDDPEQVARRWAALIGVPSPAAGAGDLRLTLDGGAQTVRFVPEPDRAQAGVVGATIAVPGGQAGEEVVAGVALVVVPA
jgi:hypothetical protein